MFQCKAESIVWVMFGVPVLCMAHALVCVLAWIPVITIPVAKINYKAIVKFMLLPPDAIKLSRNTLVSKAY